MPILESEQSATRSILLITGWGIIFGLFFGLPPALAGNAVGLAWMPYGAGAILTGLVVGFLLAFLVVTFVIDIPFRRKQKVVVLRLPVPPPLRPWKCGPNTLGQRLAEAKAHLDRLDAERERRRDSGYQKTARERIIWGELLELELQDIDEQMSRICNQAGGSDVSAQRRST